MVAHAGVKELMVRRAEEARLPYQLEVLLGGTTDAMAIQMVREGIPSRLPVDPVPLRPLAVRDGGLSTTCKTRSSCCWRFWASPSK